MNSPTLNPFPSHSGAGSPIGALVITALVLGIATAAGVLYLKWPKAAEESHASENPLAGIFSEARSDNSKDWDFYTAEIDNVIQELRTAKENYENKSKDLVATQLRLEAEKEDLARLRRDIEYMQTQLTQEIRTMTSSRPSASSPTNPKTP
jgi:hypothetical protein